MLDQATELCHRLASHGLVVASDGNASVRRGDGFYITCTLSEFETLTVEDWRWMPVTGAPTTGVSSEWRMHQVIFRHLPFVGAIVHCHPPYATSFAVKGEPLEGSLLTETGDLERIMVAKFAAPGSGALAKAVIDALGETGKACLLKQHGALTVGQNFRETVQRMERLERLAMVQWLVTRGYPAHPTPT